jgi:hypothetical protein
LRVYWSEIVASRVDDLEHIVTNKTDIDYLERRYLELEKEIANALLHGPTDDLTIADLKYRKLVVADEIQKIRRMVESGALAN